MLPKPASTVLILRSTTENPAVEDYEILLMQRHSQSPFMGGAYVFPGGKVESCDQALGQDLSLEHGLDPVVSGYAVAACRECFEEAGVLLAAPKPENWRHWRQDVQESPENFAPTLRAHGLNLRLHDIFLWAHWITPSFEGRRYDTRFFITEVDRQEEAEIDEIETTKSVWLSPSAALQANRDGHILLMPPTVHLLDELRQFPSRKKLLSTAKKRKVAAVLPRINQIAGRMAIILPWDPLYALSQGESLDFDSANPLAQTPSRIVLYEHLWKAESP